MADKIRVLIADDHAIVREGLRSLVRSFADLDLVGEATNGFDAVDKARQTKPDVILMDLVMPKMNGVDAILEIKKENPGARILVLTSFSEDDKVFPAIKAGASGYLLKDSSAEVLIQAIRDIANDLSWLDPTIARKVIREFKSPSEKARQEEESLTERELEILRMVARGMTNREISDQLFISEQTVRGHVSHILSVLHVSNRTQAALHAIRKGIASINEE